MRSLAVMILAATTLMGAQVSADSGLFSRYEKEIYPDILFPQLNLSYAAGSGALSVNSVQGFPQLSLSDNDSRDIIGGQFALNATISAGLTQAQIIQGVALSGTLDLNGTVSSLGFNSGNLLTGALMAFRADPLTGTIEFLFDMMGGDAADLFGADDTGVGILIVSSVDFPDDNDPFGSDFSNMNVQADTGATSPVVPEPQSLLLAVMGLVGVAGGARFRRNRRPRRC